MLSQSILVPVCLLATMVVISQAQQQFFTDTFAQLPEFAIGTYVPPLREGEAPATPAPFKCPVGEAGLRCAADCRTRALCTGVAAPMRQQSCATVDPQRPYCVNNACSATPDIAKPECATAFTCTGTGTFPDPHDCSVYHTCSAVAAKAELLRCPENYVFDVRELKCRRRDLTRICRRVDCTGRTDQAVVFPTQPAFYAFCVGGEQSQTIVFRCPDAENEVFSVESGRCEYQCKRAGNFADRTDCNAYQVCERRTGRLRATKVTCPMGNFYKGEACTPEGATKCVPQLKA